MQFAARQRRLEQVRSIHRAVRLAGADEGVHLVDEQDDAAVRRRHLLQHGLEPLLELAAVFCAGDQRTHVERQELLVLQAFRNIAVDDALGEALDDRGLADAGLADQHGIVLGAARQHLDGAGQDWQTVTRTEPGFDVLAYRPRTEGSFLLIERWRDQDTGQIHWQTVSHDNVTTAYGTSPETRISDPADPRRVFRWLAAETRDDRGNLVTYEYKPEDLTGVDPAVAHERHRLTGGQAGGMRHLKRIRYANGAPGQATEFAMQVVMDCGNYDPAAPTPTEQQPWPVRADAFSTYKPGFELRTYRLCRRVLLFHQFPELDSDPVPWCRWTPTSTTTRPRA